MFWKSARRFFRTLTFRLTLWYGGLFAVTCVIGFLSVYFMFSRYLLLKVDSDLLNKAKEFETLYKKEGLKALSSELDREARSKGEREVFYALVDRKGRPLASSELSGWDLEALVDRFDQKAQKTSIGFVLIDERKVRILKNSLYDGKLLILAQAVTSMERIKERYLRSFLAVVLALLLFGAPFSFLLSKKAMAGVERVTRTADKIKQGKLSQRVPLGKEGLEIEQLVCAFNSMMDRMEALVKELKEVTDNVARDLRSPITRIRGAAEMALLTGKSKEEYRAVAARVIEESDRLIEITNTMLEIAKANSGTCELVREQLDACKLVLEAIDLFEPVAKEKSIRVEKILPSDRIFLEGDRSKIQRAFANLLDNAIKYIPEGGKVKVFLRKNEKFIFFEVEDTGPGIPKEELGRIFERFYRGEKSRTTPGNGLGLSLAQAIAKVHGGRILAESSLGKGSKFSLVLPALN